MLPVLTRGLGLKIPSSARNWHHSSTDNKVHFNYSQLASDIMAKQMFDKVAQLRKRQNLKTRTQDDSLEMVVILSLGS